MITSFRPIQMKWDLLWENALTVAAMAIRMMYEHKTALKCFRVHTMLKPIYDPIVQLTRSNYQCYQMITASPWYVRNPTARARRNYHQTISPGRFFYPIIRDLSRRCTPYLTTSSPWLGCVPAKSHLIVGVIIAVIFPYGIISTPSGGRFCPTRRDTLNYSFLKVSDFRGQDFRILDSIRDRLFKFWA